MLRELEARHFKVLDGLWTILPGVNWLRGANGSGKSSFAEAIYYGLTGRDKLGSLATEHLEASKDEPLVVRLVMANGSIVERRQRRGVKTLKVNGTETTQAALEASLPAGWQTLLAIYRVGYFESLDEKTQRAIFMAVLPKLERQAVLEEMTEGSGLDWTSLAIDWSLPAPKLHEHWKGREKAAATELAKLTGRSEQLEATLAALPTPPEPRDSGDLTRELAAAKANLALLENAGLEYDVRRRRFDEAIAKNERAERAKAHNDKVEGLRDELARIRADLAQARKHLDDVRMARGERPILGPLGTVEAGSCPTCSQPVAPELLQSAKADHEVRLGVWLDVAGLIELREKIVRDLRNEEQQRLGALAALGNMIDDKRVAVPELSEEPRPEMIAAARARNNAAFEALTRFGAEEARHVLARKQRAALESELAEKRELRAASETAAHALTVLAEALHPVRGVEAEMLSRQMVGVNEIAARHGMAFLLRRPHKNGEMVDCFEVHVAGQPLALRSDGEKLAAGCLISALLGDLAGGKMRMLFVPNCNLVDGGSPQHLPEGWQVFLEQTTPGLLRCNG